VDRARRALGLRRVGHTGTLDPFATGVLPLCIGRATRLASYLSGGVKVYDAGLLLGFATTTDDGTGEPLTEARPVGVSRAEVEAACRLFVGEIDQVPPAYSAKKVAGQRLYALARRGKTVERRPVRVTVLALEILSVEGPAVRLRVRCSPGTYVRALARDIGAALGVGGHLVSLRRTHSGPFGLEQAVGWESLVPGHTAALVGKMLPMKDLLTDLPSVAVTAEGGRAVRHGRSLGSGDLAAAPAWGQAARVRLVGPAGELLALAVPREGRLHPDVVLMD